MRNVYRSRVVKRMVRTVSLVKTTSKIISANTEISFFSSIRIEFNGFSAKPYIFTTLYVAKVRKIIFYISRIKKTFHVYLPSLISQLA